MAAPQMKLGLFIRPCGHHIASWRHPLARPMRASTFRISSRWRRPPSAACSTCCSRRIRPTVWTAAESAIDRVHYVAWMEPFTLLSALSGYTKKIGLVCTASTSFEQPYSLARKFATLDIISGGRSRLERRHVRQRDRSAELQQAAASAEGRALQARPRVRRRRARAVGFLGRGRLPARQGNRHLLRPLEDARAQPPRRSSTTCAGRSTSRARRRASRSSCRPAHPTTAVSWRPKPRR